MKRDKDTSSILKECHSEGRTLLTQEERDYLACAYLALFDEEPGNRINPTQYRDEIGPKIERVMSVLEGDLIVSIEWLKRIVGELNERHRERVREGGGGRRDAKR